jgi:cellulose synthase/poly-beta-1,6-N-acetylglucosamine synthase-like glycosyltransferase
LDYRFSGCHYVREADFIVLTALSIVLSGIGLALLAPALFLFIEVTAATWSRRGSADRRPANPGLQGTRRRVAVVIPAHNEGERVVQTIQDVLPQLTKDDRLVVVADNCTDDTGAIAQKAGAEVIVRQNPAEVGKGYALDWGIRHLHQDPPDLVLFLDSDCRVQGDLISRLEEVRASSDRPLQAYYAMESPKNSSRDHSFAEFAWLLKNWVRPLGLFTLNLPVQLMGTGMMVPWPLIRASSVASGNLVEDMQLGIDLAAMGAAARFVPFVTVTSEFPSSEKGNDSQRQRWVRGHLSTMLEVPKCVALGLIRRNWDLVVLALDIAIPPLSLLALLIMGLMPMALITSMFANTIIPLSIAVLDLLLFFLTISLAWFVFGRKVLPARKLRGLGGLALAKLRLLSKIFAGRTAKDWIRTDRSGG